jgi:pilus assembly protein Flp/PilA
MPTSAAKCLHVSTLAVIAPASPASVVQPLRYHPPSRAASRGRTKGENAMTQLIQVVRSFWRNEEGQDLLEYALLVALIALVSVLAVTAAGKKVETIFNAIAAAIPAA